MDLSSAVQKASLILYEESMRPTAHYADLGLDWVAELNRLTAALKAGEILKQDALVLAADGSRRLNIHGHRKQNPRKVSETPEQYCFRSLNYELLLKVFDQVSTTDRPAFIQSMANELETRGDFNPIKEEFLCPTFAGRVSSLPVVAEFLIRTGNYEVFFETMSKLQTPTFGAAIVLTNLVDMVSFNFTIFSEVEYERMPAWLEPLRHMAHLQTHAAYGTRGTNDVIYNPHYKEGREKEAAHIVKCVGDLTKLIAQARYLYLKGALQDSPNVEIQNDKAQVEGYLHKLGFTDNMIGILNAAEGQYRSNANSFELKSCLGLLRSFLEHLHRQAAQAVAAINHDTLVDKWGPATDYLNKNGFFSKPHEEFITSLYKMISDESVHALGAERVYARLLRNVVIEYGFMFLTVLDQKGVRIPVSNA